MNKLAAIQMLRAIAAVVVVVVHAIVRQAEWQPTDQWIVETTVHTGAMGVWIFFIISGFIMSYTYYDNFAVPGAAGRFVLSRIVRVVPIYWLATVLEVALRLRHGGVDASKLICSLLFIPVAVEPGPMAAMRPTLGVGWTLNYEMMFYACFGLVLFLPRRRGLTLLILGMAGLVLVGTFAKPLTDTRDPTTLLAFYGAPIILLFGIGVLIGAGAHHLAVARTVRSSALVVAAVAALLAADCTIFATFVDAYPAGIAWLLASWLVCAICVVLCVTIRVDDTGRFARALVQLGDASYSLYLFHFFAIYAVEKLWWLVFGENGSWAFVVLASVAAILFSTLIHLLIEKPATDRLRRASASATARHSAGADTVQFETPQSTAPSGSTYLPDIAHKRSR